MQNGGFAAIFSYIWRLFYTPSFDIARNTILTHPASFCYYNKKRNILHARRCSRGAKEGTEMNESKRNKIVAVVLILVLVAGVR